MWYEIFFSILLGLIFGSFANVIIFRLPREMDWKFVRSQCPNCEKQLFWWHNIPLVSYLLLAGKCFFCKQKISLRYPFVEVAMAFMAACLLKLTPLVSLAYPFYFSFLFLMLVIAFIDFDTMLILNVMTYPAMIIYFLLLWVLPFTKPVSGILGFLVGTLSFILTAKLFYLITKKEGLGMGDVKLMGVVGLVTGVEGVIVTIFLGSLLGAVLGLLIRRFSPAVDGETHPRAFPFGPFLCLGAVTYLLYGQEIVNWYVQTFWAIPV